MPRRAALEIVSGWVEEVGCAPNRIVLQGHLELASPFPRIRTNYGAVGQGYARVWQSTNGFELTAIGAENMVILNGVSMHRAVLKPGDLLTWSDVTLRFVEHEVPEHREPNLEAAIIASPRDEACWQVYADWLMSAGDPLGERIRGSETSLPPRLEPLANDHGVLTLEWDHGFIRSAVLRSWGVVELDSLLLWLLDLPEARFLRSLEIELRSFMSRQPEWQLKLVLEQAQRVLEDAPLPALEHLGLGPLLVPIEHDLAQIVRPLRAPRLPPPGPDGFVLTRKEAWLEIERGLEHQGPLVPGVRLQLETSDLHVGSIYWDEGWSLFTSAHDDWGRWLKLNGRRSPNWQPLRHGDLIESGDWLRVRFRT